MIKELKVKLPKISSINKIIWENLFIISFFAQWRSAKIIQNKYYKYNKNKFIDLSADFRLNNAKIYKKNYNLVHKAKN